MTSRRHGDAVSRGVTKDWTRRPAARSAPGVTTAVYGQRLAAGQVEEIPDAITFAAGVPIVRGGEVIGAVAASGVRAIEDEQIAQAGADAAVEELSRSCTLSLGIIGGIGSTCDPWR